MRGPPARRPRTDHQKFIKVCKAGEGEGGWQRKLISTSSASSTPSSSSSLSYLVIISLHVRLSSDSIRPPRHLSVTARRPPPLVTVAANGRGHTPLLARWLLNSRSCPSRASHWWRRARRRGFNVQNAGVVSSADLVCVGHFG
ncbi:hypothetical protein E2C01_102674 [Portunus trituberculatus]|uniref:Uncharacterized protein n=1 Tax=Portunus trituberculatus TaxID=210409 RepID=A0A5B7KDW3_PORTR|nr:hypothetical protein [Portunus trituberculatus]